MFPGDALPLNRKAPYARKLLKRIQRESILEFGVLWNNPEALSTKHQVGVLVTITETFLSENNTIIGILCRATHRFKLQHPLTIINWANTLPLFTVVGLPVQVLPDEIVSMPTCITYWSKREYDLLDERVWMRKIISQLKTRAEWKYQLSEASRSTGPDWSAPLAHTRDGSAFAYVLCNHLLLSLETRQRLLSMENNVYRLIEISRYLEKKESEIVCAQCKGPFSACFKLFVKNNTVSIYSRLRVLIDYL